MTLNGMVDISHFWSNAFFISWCIYLDIINVVIFTVAIFTVFVWTFSSLTFLSWAFFLVDIIAVTEANVMIVR